MAGKIRQSIREDVNPFIGLESDRSPINGVIPEVRGDRTKSYKWVRHVIGGNEDVSNLMQAAGGRLRFEFATEADVKDTDPHLLAYLKDGKIQCMDLVLMYTDAKMARYWKEYLIYLNQKADDSLRENTRDRIRDSMGKRVIQVEDRDEDVSFG